jgi:DNA-binding transcriptional ArsR family regulator
MRQVHHPDVHQVALTTVLHALSDPVRLTIVRTLASRGEQCCGACGLDLPKPTLSHHFKVLRESGVIYVRLQGKQRCMSLRHDELEARFPGLLNAVLHASQPL